MNNIKLIIACVSTVLAMVATVHAKGWRGLVPFHSTRTDVERLLGTHKELRGVAFIYETKDERVVVSYSAGQCKESQSNDWNVPRDTVVSITVHPNAKLLVSDLKLDKMKYMSEWPIIMFKESSITSARKMVFGSAPGHSRKKVRTWTASLTSPHQRTAI